MPRNRLAENIKWTKRGGSERVYRPSRRRKARLKLERDPNAKTGGKDPVALGVSPSDLNIDEKYSNVVNPDLAIPAFIRCPTISKDRWEELALSQGEAYTLNSSISETHMTYDHPLPFMLKSIIADSPVQKGTVVLYLGMFQSDERYAKNKDGTVQKVRVARYVFLGNGRQFILGDLNVLNRL